MSFLRHVGTRCCVLIVLALVAGGSCWAGQPIDFRRDIRPLLSDKCFHCHGPDESTRATDLRFDLEESARMDLGGYFAIVPGKPEESELLRRVAAEDPDERMPPEESHKKRLTEDEIELFRSWIAEGANYEPHWAFQTPQRPTVPEVKANAWPLSPIDSFVLARLEEVQQTPSPEAPRVTLIRRLSFDLTGLPPSAEDVRAFAADRASGSYERLVDRLLASPHYGERMAIRWLDQVRYADTVGYHGDQPITVWPYRDYVIAAFNDNMPFDRFTREQLAGDLLPNATHDQKIAAVYNRLGMMTGEGGAQAKEYLAKYNTDRISTTAGAWLGATLGCAECHDHKYDPYTTRDFYSFGAFFADVKEKGVYTGSRHTGYWGPMLEMPTEKQRAQRKILEDAIAKAEEKQKASQEKETRVDKKKQKRREAVLAKLVKRKKKLVAQILKVPETVSTTPRTIRVLPRGNWMDDSGEVVEPAVPAFLASIEKEGRPTRLDLANWIVSRDNPLTARVFVNRVWQMLFGRGISASVDDLGGQGEWPSHPELLDWLAVEFIESGWDVKHLVKTIVMSRTYRQSSVPRAELNDLDPNNELLARQGSFYLDAELIRDNALQVSGLLTTKIGGASVKPHQPAGYYAELNFPKRTYVADTDEKQYRRGVYTHWQRSFLHPMLKNFDAPTRESCTALRGRSNTPLQALNLLNDPSMVEAAVAFASRILEEGGATDQDRMAWAYKQALSESPDEAAVRLLQDLFQKHAEYYKRHPDKAKKLLNVGNQRKSQDYPTEKQAAWTSVARALINLHAFRTRY